LTWNQLSIHDKEIFILSSDGFYDYLLAHIEQLGSKNSFIKLQKKGSLYWVIRQTLFAIF